jgi:Tol biopolymer transport system component/DNA-binding winged helix-turn-helix (wHTH) protein
VGRVYRFEDVEIDLPGFRVLKAGKAVPIEPKALNLLVFLVENPRRLIEKKELIDAVWGDAFVTENVLTRIIGQLRKALGDDVKEGRYIETVPTRGYRFIAEVTVEDDGEPQIGTQNPVTIPPIHPVSPSAPIGHPRRYAGLAVTSLLIVALVAVGVYVVRGPSNFEYLRVGAASQVTTTDGASFFPTLSPDGTRIAYTSDHGKGYEIFIRELAPGAQEVQLTSDGTGNFAPAWSPDGSLIAYSSRNRSGIWLIPAQGGTARKLTDFGARAAWSRDGQWIAFQSGGPGDFAADSIGILIPSTIWVIRADGSDARQVTRPGSPEGGQGVPSWSPDSRHIVFISDYAIWAIAVDGTGLVRLIPKAYRFFDPVYSPDGNSVVFGAATGGRNLYGLMQIRVSPGTSAPIGEPVQIMNVGATDIKQMNFSYDGRKLVYAALSMTSGIHSQAVSVAGDPVGQPISLFNCAGCRSTRPQYSPDGSKIAFDTGLGLAGVARPQVWVMNADGSGAQQLTFLPGGGIAPWWYPDSKRILFATHNDFSQVDVETRQRMVIAEVTKDISDLDFSSFSQDGKKVAFNVSRGGATNIWVMDLETKDLKQVTFDKESIGFPAWSPDGKVIAAQNQIGAENSIVIFPAEGGPITQLTPVQGEQWSHGWSPDGDKVLFAKVGDDGIWNVWSVSRSTKAQKQLTHYSNHNEFVRYPSMSPHGDRVVYEHTETTGNIWIADVK